MSKDKTVVRGRLAALRGKMKEYGINYYMIVSDDFHASEYVGDYFKCREYISGFDGSAGTLVISQAEAGLWTDGRYFLQAAEQLADTQIDLYKMGEPGVPTIPEYLREKVQERQCIGFDGRTVGASYAEELSQAVEGRHVRFVEDKDLVGEIWPDRPKFPAGRIWALEDQYTGQARKEKLHIVREKIRNHKADVLLLAGLDDIAWLCNIRGEDIDYNPIPMAYMLVAASGRIRHEASALDRASNASSMEARAEESRTGSTDEPFDQEKAVLYAAPEAFPPELAKALAGDGVEIRPYLQIYDDLPQLPAGTRLMLDRSNVNSTLVQLIPEKVTPVDAPNPTRDLKAAKNPTEMGNERLAHIQDGVAVTKLLYWLKQLQGSEAYRNGEVTEMDVAEKLLQLRQKRPGFVEQSFAPIIASGEHGAIVHYEATPETNIPLKDNTFLLMDTGGHYLRGTTDITRTAAMGELTQEMKTDYTAVLRGNLNLAAAVFRHGTTGRDLDSIAREPIWELGLDYNHGTGHGVGYLMNVHEGPQRISLHAAGESAPFEEGMLTSDEPGVYLEGKFGIRLENLMLCHVQKETSYGQFMGFETITLAPFERCAILPEQMSDRERALLNAYHKKVYDTLAPWLTKEEAEWLRAETAAF